MVTETKTYVEAICAITEFGPHARLQNWKPVDEEEICVFLAIQMSMGMSNKPKLSDYWSSNSDSLNWTPNYSRVMSRNRANRRGMPPQLRDMRLKPGDTPIFSTNPPLLTASFRDAGTVTVLCTEHDTTVISKRVRCKGPTGFRNIQKPLCIEEYNRYMGGVDRADQLCSYYDFKHRSMKWYQRYYHHVKEVALVNAYILFKESGNKLQASEFRERESLPGAYAAAQSGTSCGDGDRSEPSPWQTLLRGP
ncbi:hypothetical protein SKAU_G00413390 [Synaphobranchus kaupii]|uniref:PiggyBac transposable element-derived protein domain-containing protein n=1 Tax=Synaphobranchus kaupii TaxID=118154 RepID=A0A9Q1IB59_SYNKA|nr:hypothetical protein SKAU_G00413390 [Synaphobranchus kaupii]